jgi:hypothetical protein
MRRSGCATFWRSDRRSMTAAPALRRPSSASRCSRSACGSDSEKGLLPGIHTARYGRPPGSTPGPGIHTVRYGIPECLRYPRPPNDETRCWSRNGRALPRNRSAKSNSLFRRRNSLFLRKNSLFFRPQGIRIQHIEVTNKFLVFANAQGICPQRFEMTKGIRAVLPKKPRIRKNSLLNSLFSGNLGCRGRACIDAALDRHPPTARITAAMTRSWVISSR